MIPIVPTPDSVRSRLVQFDNDPRYYGADQAIQLVIDQWPDNNNALHILIKTVLINRLYSTQIFAVYEAAQHIFTLQIDERLRKGEISLVTDVAQMKNIGAHGRNNLSFAAKYCAWHQPDLFQIWDNLVVGLLWQYRKAHNFAEFKRNDLYCYPRFMKINESFKSFFGLQQFSRKEIDKFLYIEARLAAEAEAGIPSEKV
ncbi:MAG: hypothetical protein ABSB74_17880 [Tepidisphaeraceae bacterium]